MDPFKGLGLAGMPFTNRSMSTGTLTSREADLFEALHLQNRLAYLLLLAQNVAAGRFLKAITGDLIGSTDKWIRVMQSDASTPVQVVVSAAFGGAAGKHVKLSLVGSDSGIVDYLGNTAAAPSFGKRISIPMLLKPKQEVWINTANTGIALDANDIFSVRLLDPSELAADSAWERRS